MRTRFSESRHLEIDVPPDEASLAALAGLRVTPPVVGWRQLGHWVLTANRAASLPPKVTPEPVTPARF